MFALRVIFNQLRRYRVSLEPVSELDTFSVRLSRYLSSLSPSPVADVNNRTEGEDPPAENDVNNRSERGENPVDEVVRRKPYQKKYALLLSYLGANYLGLQYNPYGPTIENSFFEALVKAGFILEEEAKNPKHSLGYDRTSRTDSGVSALRQVVALNFNKEEPNVERINEHLPSDIRVIAFKRTIRNFYAHKQCDLRSYCYTMPTFAFCHYKNDPVQRMHYRIDADTLITANDIFQTFKGNNRFHNYTTKRDPWDTRSHRTVNNLSISNPYVVGDMEFVDLHVSGKSFMLHQIRRMVGMMIAIMRGKIAPNSVKESLGMVKMPAPTAPGLGLMLEWQDFSYYNKKFSEVREPLVWDEYDHVIERFKREYVLAHIVQTELCQGSMEEFLNFNLKVHHFTVQPDDVAVELYGLTSSTKGEDESKLTESTECSDEIVADSKLCESKNK